MKFKAHFFFLIGFTLVPSVELAIQIKKPFPGILPALLNPGSPVIIQKAPQTQKYFISSRPMSLLKNNYYLGAIDLYYEKSTFVSGLFEPVPNSFFRKLFKPQVSAYFAESISLLRPNFKKPVTLRFPASVQKNVIEADQELKNKERAMLRASLLGDEETQKNLCWRNPLDSSPVGQFGKPRYLPNKEVYFHSGLDLRAPNGTKVHAAADGTVRFAQKLIVPGNIIALYHGDGLISMYMHLSKIKVTPGQMVKRGELIAYSGDTGRAEGPHLHWEVRWKGISLDPLALTQELKKVPDTCSSP